MENATQNATQNFDASNIDYTTPQSFARSILPWLSEKTGLKYDPQTMEFPYITIVNHPFFIGNILADGIYTPNDNEIIAVPSEITLTHELTHYLQHMNNKLQNAPVLEVERQAFYSMQHYVKEIVKDDPKKFSVSDDDIIERLKGYKERNIK